MRHFLWLWGPLEPQEESHKWSFFFNAQFHTRPIFFPPANLFFGIFWLFAGGKKNWPERPVQSFVTRSGRIRAQILFFVMCPNLSNIYQNLSNFGLGIFWSEVHLHFVFSNQLWTTIIIKNIKNFDEESLYLTSHYGMKRRRLLCLWDFFLCFFLLLGRVIEREIPQLQPSD